MQASFPASLPPAPTELRGRRERNPFGGWSRPEKLGRVAPFPELLVSKLSNGDPRRRRGGAWLAASLWEKVAAPRGVFLRGSGSLECSCCLLPRTTCGLIRAPGQITPASLTRERVLIQCESIHPTVSSIH